MPDIQNFDERTAAEQVGSVFHVDIQFPHSGKHCCFESDVRSIG